MSTLDDLDNTPEGLDQMIKDGLAELDPARDGKEDVEHPDTQYSDYYPEQGQRCICDYPDGATVEERKGADGHYNEAGGFCCRHHGNTCGYCHQYG